MAFESLAICVLPLFILSIIFKHLWFIFFLNFAFFKGVAIWKLHELQGLLMCPNDEKNAMKYNLLVLGESLNLMQISHDII